MKFKLTILYCLLSFCGYSIDFSKLNTHYWYNPNAEIRVDYSVAQQNEKLLIYIQIISFNQLPYKLVFLNQSHFEDINHDTLTNLAIDTLFLQRNKLILSIELQPKKELFVVLCQTNTKKYFYPLRLKRGLSQYPSIILLNHKSGLPIFNVSNFGEALQFNFLEKKDTVFITEYFDDFKMASTPLNLTLWNTPTTEVRRKLTFLPLQEKIILKPNHLYTMQLDTSSTTQTIVYCVPKYFPKLVKLEELIPALSYIATNDEIQNMQMNENAKNTFDNFWLQLFGSMTEAKLAIKNYYQTVFYANEMFTDYKMGWKTDRGMIYIVYGKPMEVYRENNYEKWNYPDSVQFEYRVISNYFTHNQYILKVNANHQNRWTTQVQKLRGILNE